MELKLAKQIVGQMSSIYMSSMGVIPESKDVDLSKYCLSELITANKLVSENNDLNMKKGKNKISIQITIADRGIAAIYTLLHHEPIGEVITSFDGRHIAVLGNEHVNITEE